MWKLLFETIDRLILLLKLNTYHILKVSILILFYLTSNNVFNIQSMQFLFFSLFSVMEFFFCEYKSKIAITYSHKSLFPLLRLTNQPMHISLYFTISSKHYISYIPFKSHKLLATII